MTAPAAVLPPELDKTLRDLFGPEAQGVQQGQSRANEIAAPNEPEDTTEPLSRLRALMAALYGSDFPLIRALDEVAADDPQYEANGIMPPMELMLQRTQPDEWSSWVRGRWTLHGPAVQPHLYLVARNRLFRAGNQWVSSSGLTPWRTPQRPTDSARVVHNLIAPALDQRVQMIAEQRPGFQVEPTSLSPDEKRKADGRQQALEYQFDEQDMKAQIKVATYWAGTDGVAFWHTFWDRDAGPLDERMGTNGTKKPLGDLRTKTVRCEQVRVSANATASEPPYYAFIREVLSETEAAYLYGAAGIQDRATTGDTAGNNESSGMNADGSMPSYVMTQTIVGEGHRLQNIKTVERFYAYVGKHPDVLPDGLQLVVVGNAVVWGPGELLFGVIPLVPVRDGSTDPSYLPRPVMEQWIPPQMRVNAALSLWVNNARLNSGGSFFARPDAVSRETFTGTGRALIEIEGSGPIEDQIQATEGFGVGQDVKDLIAFDVKAIEDMSGYNDVSRGQVSNETATAVATANEQIQRIFAPPVEAVAEAFQQWAPIQLAGMAWGYDLPRDVGAIGSDRPDLARALSSEDFEGPSTVRVDAEKMMPVPKFVRKQQMDELLDRQLITPQQYMRNIKFASVKNLESPDEDQTARAKRVADAIRMGQPIPPAPPLPNTPPAPPVPGQPPPQDPVLMAAQPLAIRWQTNEAIEQDVLEREILLQDDLDPQIVAVAAQRWSDLAAQAQAKMPQPPPDPAQVAQQQAQQQQDAQTQQAQQQQQVDQQNQQAEREHSVQVEAQKAQTALQLEEAKHRMAMEQKQADAEIALNAAPPPPPPAPPPEIVVEPPDMTPVAKAIDEIRALVAPLVAKVSAPPAEPQAPPVVHVHPSAAPQVNVAAPVVNVDRGPSPDVNVNVPPEKKGKRKGKITDASGKTSTFEIGDSES